MREALADVIAGWSLGAGDLALGGGARGADLLFEELALDAGAHVVQLLPMQLSEFIPASVRLQGSGWEERFRSMLPRVETVFQPERLGHPAEGDSVFERNNRWLLRRAWAESAPKPLLAVLVWDKQNVGDGPGGTADVARRLRRLGCEPEIITPMEL